MIVRFVVMVLSFRNSVFRLFVIFFSAVLLTSCVSLAAQGKAEEMVLRADSDINESCKKREVVKYEGVDMGDQDSMTNTTERWIVDSCGKQNSYLVNFKQTASYGSTTTRISVRPESGKVKESVLAKNIARKNGCENPGKARGYINKAKSERKYIIPCGEKQYEIMCDSNSCWLN